MWLVSLKTITTLVVSCWRSKWITLVTDFTGYIKLYVICCAIDYHHSNLIAVIFFKCLWCVRWQIFSGITIRGIPPIVIGDGQNVGVTRLFNTKVYREVLHTTRKKCYHSLWLIDISDWFCGIYKNLTLSLLHFGCWHVDTSNTDNSQCHRSYHGLVNFNVVFTLSQLDLVEHQGTWLQGRWGLDRQSLDGKMYRQVQELFF